LLLSLLRSCAAFELTTHGFNVLYPFTEAPIIPVKHWRLWDIGVTWKDINPARGVWNFDRLDAVVDLAESLGVSDLCLVLGCTPQWAASNPHAPHFAPWIGEGSNSLPKDTATFDEYVVHTVNRYKGRIKYYQIWNEPQLADFMYPYTDVNKLAAMTKNAKRLITIIDPKALVVSAPVILRPSSGGVRRSMKYLSAMQKVGWPVDILAAHLYPDGTRGALRFAGFARQWKKLLRDTNAPKSPLWVTEMNYNLLQGALPDSKIPRRISATDRIARALGISRIYWYGYGTHTIAGTLGISFTDNSVGSESLRALL